MKTTLILGTRGSRLAMAQARMVADALRRAHSGVAIRLRVVRTTGDRDRGLRLASGDAGEGIFARELEEALRRADVDLAVHSLKDLPVCDAEGLVIGAILRRGDPADVLVSKHPGGLRGLPRGARVGTSSPRRANQLLLARSDLKVVDIRGNVPTRIRKLSRTQSLDAIVLARAGLDRLGPAAVPPSLRVVRLAEMLPAPGQGAIAVQCRAADRRAQTLLQAVHHPETAACVQAERALLAQAGGGCHLPLGALARMVDGTIRLRAALFDQSGVRWLRRDF